jgi:Tol biopolymer transport system component
MNRTGNSTTTTNIPGKPIDDLRGLAVSSDGARAVFSAGARPQSNLFVRDLATGIDTRLPVERRAAHSPVSGTDQVLLHPSWFPAGDRVLYAAGAVVATNLIGQRADGAGEPVVLGEAMYGRVSPDGRWLLWLEDERGQGRLRFASFDNEGRIGSPARSFPAFEKLDIRSFDLLPGGNRLLAFTVRDPNGQTNIHLVDFPGGEAKWQVTTEGGTSPRFSPDGRELFFLSGARNALGVPEGRLMVMTLATQPAVKLEPPRVFLSGEATPAYFDTASGSRLLVARPHESSRKTTATLIQNWPALLQQR